MTKLFLTVVFVLGISGLNAQDYKITFTGTGESNLVDSVEVQNLTRETFIVLPGTDTLLLSGTLGIEEPNSNEHGMLVYPNPSSQTTKISFDNSNPGGVEIEVREITGKTILTKDYTLPRATHTFIVAGLKTGIYLLQVRTPKEIYAERVIVSSAAGDSPELMYEGSTNFEFHPKNYKHPGNVAVMNYRDGERLLFKGHSSHFATVLTMVPDKSQQVAFDFVECTDADSNHYAVVRIGYQTWMAENLKTTHYQNGESVYSLSWYSNNETLYKEIYGALYSFYAIYSQDRNLCPAGWVVPAVWDWDILTNHLGENAGGKMKSTGTSLWRIPNTDATNESGFTGLPGGARNEAEIFGDIGEYGHWWSSTNIDLYNGWHRMLYRGNGFVGESSYNEAYRFSVRCIKQE